MHAHAEAGEEGNGSVGRKNFRRFQHAKVELSHYFHPPSPLYHCTLEQTPLALKASEIKENNAISHLTDDNIILYPLLPSDTLDQ